MASYKAHMAFGIFTAIGWSFLLFSLSIVSIWIMPLVIFLTVVGSFLPDLDSDTGLPLKILLTIFSILVSVFVGLLLLISKRDEFIIYIIYISLSYLFSYYGIGRIIKKITRHRGIFHSIPSVFLSTLLTLTFLNYFSLNSNIKMILSISIGIGYLSHLILDEMNSVVNLEGVPFIPKKSLGSALKFYSSQWRITLIVYSAVIFLFMKNWKIINSFYLNIFLK
jgi:membrane-bound metal-dependent hydrolase YbcI (DUF457 family)